MIHWTGPSAQRDPAASSEFGGIRNSWNARKSDDLPSPFFPAGAAVLSRAASNEAIAFFEYIEGSIEAFGRMARNVSKSACAFSAFPRLASQTPR
jgi:hypothetical protein